MITLETLFVDNWLPRFPMATDYWRDGVKLCRREEALTKTHIELAPKARQNWFVMDFDIPNAEDHLYNLINKEEMPTPNFAVTNPNSGHLHTWHLLEFPVSGDKALEFRKDITKKASVKWNADKGYVNRFGRNPFLHQTEIFHDETTTLRTLWDALKDVEVPVEANASESLSKADTAGLGRNSALFELLRHFAYSNFWTYRTDKQGFYIALLEKAFELNLAHNPNNLLPHEEVQKVVWSVTNWTFKKFNAGFVKVQKRRNAKSVKVRQEKARMKYEEVTAYISSGFTLREACESLNLNFESVRKSYKKWEELYGG